MKFFYSTFTLDFLFSENKRKTVREIRVEYVHRGQTYLTASHSQLRYVVIFLISRRDGQNNGLLAGVPLLPPP